MFDKMACAGLFGHYASAAYHIQGQSSLNTPGMINMTIKQPYGVVAAIIPWNVSLIMFAMKVAPAIAAGNAIIVKTSEKAPLAVSSLQHHFNNLYFANILPVSQARCPDQASRISTGPDQYRVRIRKYHGKGAGRTHEDPEDRLHRVCADWEEDHADGCCLESQKRDA